MKMFPTFVREAIANGYLLVTEATRMRDADADSGGIQASSQGDAVTLALTTKALIIFSATNDVRDSLFSLEDLAPQETDAAANQDDSRMVISFKKPPSQVTHMPSRQRGKRISFRLHHQAPPPVGAVTNGGKFKPTRYHSYKGA